MKTLEVIEYLLNEIAREIDYNDWYKMSMEEFKESPEYLKNKERYLEFLFKNKLPNNATIKQNLIKIRKLTLILEKELR